MDQKEDSTPRKCYRCGSAMTGGRQNYKYTECGLSSVVLVDIVVFNCKACGAIVPEIPAVDALHGVIAMLVLRKEDLLSGEEIRFLRTMANYTATQLAKVMGVTKSALSRWENDKAPIGDESDRLLRFACLAGIAQLGTPAIGPQAERIFDLAKEAKSMNLPDILANIERASGERDGSRQITITSSMLDQFGPGGEGNSTLVQ